MQLLQQRDFSQFFSDTFKFIKENGKHFFTNYFIINGIFLILQFVKNYYTGQLVVFPALVEFLYLVLILVFSVVNYTFVSIYMILYNERGTNFNYMDIIAYYKENAGKIAIFILMSIIIAIPAGIVFYIVLLLSLITIVGPFLVYAAFVVWFSMAFYEYLFTNKGVTDCFGYAWTLLTKKFWAITGSTALLFLIIIVIFGFMMSLTGVFSSFADMNNTDPLGNIQKIQQAFFSPVTLVVTTFFTVFMVTLQITQGIIYFSQKELLENISANNEIDQIGKIEF